MPGAGSGDPRTAPTNQPAEETSAPALSPASGSSANVTVAMNLPLPIVIAGGGVVLVALVVLAMLLKSGTAKTPDASGVGHTPPSTSPATIPIKATNVGTPEPQPPPAPKPAPSPKPGPTPPVKLSADQLVEKFGGAVVWMGFEENNGQKLPLSTGWAVTPNTVVTTAACVADLKELKNDGHRIFVAHGQSAPQMIAITNLRTHPRYAEKDGDGRSSLFHNIGMVTLESPLPVHCELLPSAKLPKPVVGTEVTVLGYVVTKQNYKPFDALNPLALVRGSGRIKDTRPLAGMPLLVLDVPVAAGINGAPVFEPTGKVIGLMWHLGESSHAVPHVVLADYIQELLP